MKDHLICSSWFRVMLGILTLLGLLLTVLLFYHSYEVLLIVVQMDLHGYHTTLPTVLQQILNFLLKDQTIILELPGTVSMYLFFLLLY